MRFWGLPPISCALLVVSALLSAAVFATAAPLRSETVFKERAKFDQLVARGEAWQTLPIGERTAAVGRALVGTPYKSFTLEIDDHLEAPSVNLNGFDCWTFFESALAFARMLDVPREQWTPETMLKFIELDRYRGGKCDGTYLSRLHYLEDWQVDNQRRGLIDDLTRQLGGVRARHVAGEMTIKWKSYRYLRANPSLRPGIRAMEERVKAMPLVHIPKANVAAIESRLRSGDIIGVTTNDPGGVGTSHVGLAYRTDDGVLHFMHASAPRNYGKVVVDSRLSEYLRRYRTIAGATVARPTK
jgi:cell wall-associated NlpC family hydrolase